MATEIDTLRFANMIIKLLARFFDSNMTKEELVQEYRKLLVTWEVK